MRRSVLSLLLALVVCACACLAVALPFCGVKDSNGNVVIDLTPLQGNAYDTVDDPDPARPYEYEVAFCQNTNEPCGAHGDHSLFDAVTQFNRLVGGTCHTVGNWDDSSKITYIDEAQPNLGARIVYVHGDAYNHVNANRSAVIDVFCDQNYPDPKSPQITFAGEDNEVYLFEVNTKAACPVNNGGGGGGGGLSGGSIFLIILGCLVAVYLAVGISIQLVRGKRGADAFPNADFWKSFFGAVGDGIALVFCCRSPSASGYSSDAGAPSTNASYGVPKSGGAEGYQNI